MWDYARMAQIAGKLGGPARTGALIFGAGMILGGVIVDGAYQAMRQVDEESRRKADMAAQARRLENQVSGRDDN